jgi:molybdopterin converting factor small subunit
VPTVRLRGQLKQLAGDEAEHRVAGDSVAVVLRELERLEPALDGWVMDERGALRRHINVFVNGEMVGQDAPVAENDRVEIIPAISGG